ncbi:MAG: 1-acyl-sn-glycerol-3-phosphate acyltransferase [Myxococcales bacterium]|nr:1-acyl-sn-glycerol-3-phosphate acyltransferase [Myxococcales bacterium]
MFSETIEAGETSLVFLEKPTEEERSNRLYSQAYLQALVDYGRRDEGPPLTIVPLLLVWDKRSESYHRTLFDEMFGSRQSPGRLRKFLNLVQNIWQSLARAGSPTVEVAGPIELTSFVRSTEDLDRTDAALKLRSRLLEVFSAERRVIVGPPMKPAAMIRREVMASDQIQDAIRQEVRETRELYPARIEKRARKMVKEIAAEFSLVAIKFLSALMNPIFDTLYQGFEIDAAGLDKVRQTVKNRRIIIVPSHKSHMDYLIISNVFYQHGLMPPHIAAGVNLSFWPLGPIFRRAGAFFLRRTFKGDELYSAVFREYLIKIIREGFPIEFFIEGTRSRTGKLSRPRYGMLSMVLESVIAGRIDKVAIVPVSVGYESIVESTSYQKEMLGDEKQSENLSGVLKATKVLRSKYGRVYVEFEDPIDLDEYVAEHDLSPEAGPDFTDRQVRRLAYQIIDAINACTTVTPSAVAATVLLNNPSPETPQDQLVSEIGFLVNYLLAKGARLANSLAGPVAQYREVLGTEAERTDNVGLEVEALPSGEPLSRSDLELGQALKAVTIESMRLFKDKGHVRIKSKDGEVTYVVEDKERPSLAYYRNNIVHFFINEAVLASALTAAEGRRIDVEKLKAQCLLLSRAFKYEFCFPSREGFGSAFDGALETFEEMGWLARKPERPGVVFKAEQPPAGLEFLRGLVLIWIESYWLVSDTLGELLEALEEREFIKRCFKKGRQLYQDRQLIFFESLSKPTFSNVLAVFKERGVIEPVAEVDGKRGDKLLRLGAEWREGDRFKAFAQELAVFRRPQDRSSSEPLRATGTTEVVPTAEKPTSA